MAEDPTTPTPAPEEIPASTPPAEPAPAEAAAPDAIPDADLPPPAEPGISEIRIEDEMQNSFIDYSMSVIVSRALPDARDGMKPVHRRCIYAMGEIGNVYSQKHKKSAAVVGEVMGKYHPHGDSSIYETIVRMAQPFSMRYLMVDGHGNFGSMDGDGAAAMRYTEVRMQRYSEDLLADLDKETVDMVPNYDETHLEPTVLPSKLPNLLLNGSMGIAVGMATNIPTHNLDELCDAIVALVDNPRITVPELMQYVKGPDFPTGGIICGTQAIRDMYLTGRGSLCVRGRAEIVERHDGTSQIVITEIPYNVNKAEMVAKMGELVRNRVEKLDESIADIRDLSKADVRIEIDLKKDAYPQVVLNHLYRLTPLQSSFGANMLALDRGRPKVMNLKQMLKCFVDHRVEVITRRTKYLLRKARERAHLLEGFRTAIDNIDEIVHIIRSSQTDDEAKARMFERFGLDDVQASAILEMRLKQLTGLSRDKIEEEYQQLLRDIERYEFILANPSEVLAMIKADCEEMKQKYGDPRRTTIEASASDISVEDLIPNERCVITLSERGYVKRCSLDEFREQKRGGKGKRGAAVKDEDSIKHLFTPMTHDRLLFFTSHGRVFTGKAWEIPEGSRAAAGRAMQNGLLLRKAVPEGTLDKDGNPVPPREAERVVELVPLDDAPEGADRNDRKAAFTDSQAILFATRKGVVKKTRLDEYKNVNKNGIIAIRIDDDDELVDVALVERGDELILVSADGMSVRFEESQARLMGRSARGVRGIRLAGVTFGPAEEEEPDDNAPEETPEEDEGGAGAQPPSLGDSAPDAVRALVKVEKDPAARLLLVVENGYGALNDFADYPLRKRGGKGVHAIKTSGRNGKVVFASAVRLATDDAPADTLLLITEKGQTLRTRIDTIRETNRYAMGVRLFAVDPSDRIVSASVASTDPDDDDTPPPPEEPTVEPAPSPADVPPASSGSAGDPPAEQESGL